MRSPGNCGDLAPACIHSISNHWIFSAKNLRKKLVKRIKVFLKQKLRKHLLPNLNICSILEKHPLMKRKYYLSEWHWWLAGDVCGNVIVTDEIWREDYHCRGGLHTPQTKYWIIFLQRKNNTYDGGVTDPQRLSADASGREGGAEERLGLSKKKFPLDKKIFYFVRSEGSGREVIEEID